MRIIYKIFSLLSLLFISNSLFAQLDPMVIGTIKPGDSIVIYYDVTINSGAGTSVTNQGTITGTGINLVTDDPDNGVAGDATVTLLNVFPLPVRMVDVNAFSRGNAIEVKWNVSGEEGMIKYEVEKSSNGRSFTKIGEVAARNNASLTDYAFSDNNPASGANLYRLRMVDGTSARYSPVVRVDLDGKNGGIKIYPNPSVNGSITLQLSNMQKGSYDLLLYNNIGQVVYKKLLEHDGGSSTKNITLPSRLSKGMYTIKIMQENNLYNQFIVIQ